MNISPLPSLVRFLGLVAGFLFLALACGSGDKGNQAVTSVLVTPSPVPDTGAGGASAGGGSDSPSAPSLEGDAPRQLSWQPGGQVDVSFILIGVGWDPEGDNLLLGNTLVIARVQSGEDTYLETAGWLEGQVNETSGSNPGLPGSLTSCQAYRAGKLVTYTLVKEENRLSCIQSITVEEDDGEVRPDIPLWQVRLKPDTTLTISDGPVAVPASFDREITLLDPPLEGEDIRLLQFFLVRLGYPETGVIDGIWGPASNRALRHFQKDKGLPVDGRITPELMDILFSSLPLLF